MSSKRNTRTTTAADIPLSETTRIYFDTGDREKSSKRYCIEQIRSAATSHPNAIAVDSPKEADILHLNTIPFRRRDLDLLRIGTPAIATQHGGYLWWADRRDLLRDPDRRILYFLRGIFRASQYTVRKIGFSTQFTRDLALNVGRIKKPKTEIIPLGRNENYRPKAPTDTDDPFIIVAVNNQNPRKNIPTIVETMRKMPDVRFVLPGKMWPDYPGQLPENADVVGFVSEERLIDYFNHATALYFPTLYEGFGLPFVEAMACETAVVANPCGAALELCGDAALYVDDPFDADEHATRIRRLIDNDEFREQYEQRGPEQAAPYTWENTARKYMSIYERIVHGNC